MASTWATPVDRPPPRLEAGEHVNLSVDNVGCMTSPKPAFGLSMATNLRLIYRFNPQVAAIHPAEIEIDDLSIPHTTIYKIESTKEGSSNILILCCRAFRQEVFSFPSKEFSSTNFSQFLEFVESKLHPKNFNFTFARYYRLPESKVDGWTTFNFKNEFARQKIDLENWRITSANRSFALCKSYPREFIVPSSVKDASVYHVAQLRIKGRVPALCWLNPSNNAGTL